MSADTEHDMGNQQSSKIASTWASMKTNLQNFRSNMAARRFMPLRQSQDSLPHEPQTHESSSESLDEIFARIRKAPVYDDDFDRDAVGPSRYGR